jgi:AbrB family looped-hinge helix DNA binding protein
MTARKASRLKGFQGSWINMETVTLSPKFQIVIPKAIREQLGLRPKQKLAVVRDGARIQLAPLESARKLKGFLRGIDTGIARESDRTSLLV